MVETGGRAGEVIALRVADVNLSTGPRWPAAASGKGRSVPFGARTSWAIDRYLRVRRTHRLAGTDALWLGDRGKEFSNDALHKTLGEERAAAGSPPAAPRVA